MKDPGPAGREIVRQYTERACTDPEFVAKYLGPDADAERRILYEDPDLQFCILAHVYKGAKSARRTITARAGQSTVRWPASRK